MPVAIICQGPTGVGYFCEVMDLPARDRGVVARRHGAFVVCDAAIVAYLCARQFPGQVHLVTNNLGSVAYESQLIRTKLGDGVEIHEDPLPFSGAPIDMTFVDRGRGARSYATTDYYPSTSHLVDTTRDLRRSLPPNCRTVSYVDIEVATDGGRAALEAAPLLTPSDSSVWNVGQVAALSELEDWLSGRTLPGGATIQASLGDSNVTARDLRSTYGRVASAMNQTLVVTLGSNGAAWVDDESAEVVPVEPVSDAFTLGAGANLASSLVAALASEDSPDVRVAFSGAVAAANRYVIDASVDGDMHGLDYWSSRG